MTREERRAAWKRIPTIDQHIEALESELATMSTRKAGTAWHLDRVRALADARTRKILREQPVA